MENYNQTKRTADEAGLNASKASPNRKQAQKFYLPAQLTKDGGEVQCHVNWTGKKVPIYVSKGYKVPSDGKVRTKSIGTPMLPTKFVDLSPNGDVGKFGKTEVNASYNMGVVRDLPEKITRKMPQAQDAVDEFYTNLRNLIDEMITTGWKTDGVWTKWKKSAEKELKKILKKDPESKVTAEEIFKENAKTSVLGKWEDQETGDEHPMYCFSTKYQMNIQGEIRNNRPTFWKQIRNEYGDRSVKDISDDLPSKKSGLKHGSVVKFGFELNAFDLDTMYGIKAKLGRNILCVHLEKSSQRSVGDMLGQDTYFSDDED